MRQCKALRPAATTGLRALFRNSPDRPQATGRSIRTLQPGVRVACSRAFDPFLVPSRLNARMKGVFAFAVIAAVAGAIAWLVLKARQLERQRHFERRVQARKLGWTYDDQRAGRIDYRFAGSAAGIDWEMWYDSDRGDKSPTPRATWRSNNLRTQSLSLVIIGRKRFGLESGVVGRVLLGVVSGIAQAMAGHGVGSDKTDFYDSAIDLPEGRPLFRERFAVAIAPDMPRGWVDEQLQGLLMNWAAPSAKDFRTDDSVEVNLRADGLQIVVQRMPEDFASWQHLARLGEHIAQQLVRAGARP